MIFCPSCGKQLSDEESTGKFCPYCGASIVNETAPKGNDFNEKLNNVKEGATTFVNKAVDKAQEIPGVDKVLNKVDKKFWPAILGGAVAVVVLLLVLIFGGLFSSGHKTQMNTYVKLINKKNTNHEKFVKATSTKDVYNFYKTGMEISDDAEDEMDEVNESWEEIYDTIDDEYDKWKISFKVKSTESGDKSDRKKLEERYEDLYDDSYEDEIDELEDTLDDDDKLEEFADGMDVSEKKAKKLIKSMIKCFEGYKKVKVSDIKKVKGNFIIKADGKKYESDTVKFRVAKINGEWVLYEKENVTFDEDDKKDVAVFMPIFDNLRGTATSPYGLWSYVSTSVQSFDEEDIEDYLEDYEYYDDEDEW